MEKEFVPYKLAIKLKALGFDEPCFAGYTHSKWIGTGGPNSRYFHAQLFSNHQFDEDEQEFCSAPLFSQAFRWFREKYKLCNNLGYTKPWKYSYRITSLEISKTFEVIDGFNTYEEAELACLTKLIEIVETRTK